jgi:acylphosphatase
MQADEDSPVLRRLEARIRGRVQGVGYRYGAIQAAGALTLSGWVRNLPDGSVELVAEGPREALEELLTWCRRGPRSARVEALEARFVPATGEFQGFDLSAAPSPQPRQSAQNIPRICAVREDSREK